MKLSINESLEALELVMNHDAAGMDGLTKAYMDKHDADIVLGLARAIDAYTAWTEYRSSLYRLDVIGATEDADQE